MTKPFETPLPGLLITSNEETAVKAMFARNFDIVILRHPTPASFEIAGNIICEARPDLLQIHTASSTFGKQLNTQFVGELMNGDLWRDCAKDVVTARGVLQDWFTRLKTVAARVNPHAKQYLFGTRSGYSRHEGDERPRAGFHADTISEITATQPLPWRVAMTVVGGGTQIIDKRALRALCNENNPRIAKAREAAANDFPYPPQGQADDELTRLKRNARMSEILFQGQTIISAKCGDMVFIAQKRPECVWHATPQYDGKPRLAFVLDMA